MRTETRTADKSAHPGDDSSWTEMEKVGASGIYKIVPRQDLNGLWLSKSNFQSRDIKRVVDEKRFVSDN